MIDFTNMSFGFLVLNHTPVSEMLVSCLKGLIGKEKILGVGPSFSKRTGCIES